MLTKRKYKNLLETVLFEMPKDLICIICEYQDCIFGEMIYKWMDSIFQKPHFLRIQNQNLFILDVVQNQDNWLTQDRILCFKIAKNKMQMIYNGQLQKDYFFDIVDFYVNRDETEIFLLDSCYPLFRTFSLPDFTVLDCLHFKKSLPKPKKGHFYDAYGITSDGTYYYVTFPNRIDQFDHNLQMKQSFEAKCLIRPNRILYENDLLWSADEKSGVVHVMSLDGKCNYHCGEGILKRPQNFALYGQEVFVVDQSCIYVFDRNNGHFLRSFGSNILSDPFDIFIYQGQAWVTDLNVKCIFIFE